MGLNSTHAPHHQIRTGLGRIFHLDVQPRFHPRSNHQAVFLCQLPQRRFDGVEHLGHHRRNNRPLNLGKLHLMNVKNHFQVNGIFIGGFGGIRPQPGFKENITALDTTDDNVGIANIHRNNHLCSSKSAGRISLH